MKKELVMIIIIIILVTIGHIVTLNYTQSFFDNLENDLENLKAKILSENNEKEVIENDIGKINNKWQEKCEVLAYYIEHDELEKIGAEITHISSAVEVDEYEEALMETEKCIFLLKHVKDKDSLKLVNIF